MPTVEENSQAWESKYDWTHQGEEWSSEWGGSEAQWYGSIGPRIHNFIPTDTVLEIAPGYGRWTNFLRHYCRSLIIIDLSEKCISACRKRFAADAHITYHVNDGRSLSMIRDTSIDFVFSFDSLVHAEADVLEIYLNQLALKLKPNGIGFIHHSNLGMYRQTLSLISQIPQESRDLIVNKVFLSPTHWRASSMTAGLFQEYCAKAGLRCISQELINWGNEGLLIDCFSVCTPQNSVWSRPTEVVENREFMKEAHLIKNLSRLYTVKDFFDKTPSGDNR